MFNFIRQWSILFVLIDILQCTIQIPTNNTLNLSFGFFCVFCGRIDQINSHMSFVESKRFIDCSQPYHIYCSYKEAIGCVKYIKMIDYHIDITKDCLRFAELSSLSIFDIQCRSEYSTTNVNIKEKIFCCNNTHFCNQTSSLYLLTKTWLQALFYFFIFLVYYYHSI
ncbi:unnamed protein product [Rotaria sp. Silwood1]|nr:unnamed protein product [Rotaria sp. Silwood1]CAF4678231.1 unnamed protein product [Rotaria sp. Silwood1]